jgi:hypothetical protein
LIRYKLSTSCYFWIWIVCSTKCQKIEN